MEVAHSRNSEVFNSFTLETKMKKQGGPRLVWHGIDLHSKHNWGMGAPKQRPAPKRKSLQKRGTTQKEHDRKRRELMWNAASSPPFLSQAIIHPHKNPIFDTRERKQLIVLNQKLAKDSSHYCPPLQEELWKSFCCDPTLCCFFRKSTLCNLHSTIPSRCASIKDVHLRRPRESLLITYKRE